MSRHFADERVAELFRVLEDSGFGLLSVSIDDRIDGYRHLRFEATDYRVARGHVEGDES